MITGVRQYWFLVTLLAVLASGFALPGLWRPAAELPVLPDLLVAGVLFMTALPHDFAALHRTLHRPGPAVLAIAVNAIAIPLAAWPISWLLPTPFRLGLIVAASVPSTLVSATVWTRRAGGNDLVPIIVTVVTNLACVVVSPFWIWLLADRDATVIDPGHMAARLMLLVVVPLVASQCARQSRRVAAWTARHPVLLGVASQVGILVMIGLGIVKTGSQLSTGSSGQVGVLSWILLGGAVLALHLAAFGFGWRVGQALGYDRANRIAVGFAGSQKTLMIGLHLALSLGGGPVLLPIIAYHVLQLVVDTVIADRLRGSPGRGPL